MLVLRFNHQRRRQPPQPQVPQDELPRVDVPPPGQSIREQLRHAHAQQQLQAWYPSRRRPYSQAKQTTRRR